MIAMRYGAIPIVRETGGLFDTVFPIDIETGEGRGLTFKTYNAHDMLDGIDRGLKLYYDENEVFYKIVKSNMQTDFSWDKPAMEYIVVYESMLQDRKGF